MSQGQLWSMMISRVPPPALPDLRPAVQLACPARPLVRIEECRAAGAAARGRCAAPNPSPAAAGLGRPRDPCRTYPAPATELEGAPASHARHRPAVAPPAGHPEVDLPAPDRPAAGQLRDHRTHRAPGYRERFVGLPADPGRAAQARLPGWRIYNPPGSHGAADPPGHRSGIPTRPGGSSCTRKPRQCLRRISFTSTAR